MCYSASTKYYSYCRVERQATIFFPMCCTDKGNIAARHAVIQTQLADQGLDHILAYFFFLQCAWLSGCFKLIEKMRN